jgi:hypothetical protein
MVNKDFLVLRRKYAFWHPAASQLTYELPGGAASRTCSFACFD